jgi:ABC-type transporter Mla MlaB component
VEPRPIVLAVGGRITPADIPGLCARARMLLERSDTDLVTCDVSAIADPDAVTVDALARLQLAARRHGRAIRFRDPGRELQELLGLMGLGDVLESGSD